jgi:hypothetical protein
MKRWANRWWSCREVGAGWQLIGRRVPPCQLMHLIKREIPLELAPQLELFAGHVPGLCLALARDAPCEPLHERRITALS